MLSFLTCAGIPTELAWLVDEAEILFGGHFFVQFFGVDEKKIHTTRVEHQRIVVAKTKIASSFGPFCFFLRYSLEIIIPIWSPTKTPPPWDPPNPMEIKALWISRQKNGGKIQVEANVAGKIFEGFPSKKWCMQFGVGVIE